MGVPDEEWVGLREFARLVGVSPNAVAKAIKNGRITRLDGKIHWATQSVAWNEYRDPSKIRDDSRIPPRGGLKPKAAPPPRRQPEPDEDDDEDIPEGLENDESYLEAKRVKEWAAARLKELELAKAKGEVLYATVVQDAMAQLAIDVREAVMSIPDRVAGELASEVAKAGQLDVAAARELVHKVWKRESRRVLERIGQPSGER
jgi:hypothetical protein